MISENTRSVIKLILNYSIAIIMLLGVIQCTMNITERDNTRQAIRDENGGVLPGKEALILENGRTVRVMTILHEGQKYTCFASGHGLACTIQEKSCD